MIHFHKISVKKLIVMYILSGGLYQLFWYHNNWVIYRRHHNLDINPILLTLGLFIPVYNIYVIYKQFKLVKDYAIAEGVKTYQKPGLLALMYVILPLIYSVLLSLLQVDILFSLTSYLLILIILIKVQYSINIYWDSRQEEDIINSNGYSSFDFIILLIGIVILLPFVV